MKITITERIIVFVVASILMLITCAVLGIFLAILFRWQLAEYPGMASIYSTISLVLSFLVGIAGFIVGANKISEFFGFIWRTNKPKDGNWF